MGLGGIVGVAISVLAVTAKAAPGVGPDLPETFVHAVRTRAEINVDGKLDEEAWARARVYSNFVESFPNEGARPDQRTEVRVLYDDDHLYVGIHCFDAHPELLNRQLGRRDSLPTADRVSILIDSNHDLRTAYEFSINAAGVLRDALWYGDVNSTDIWDAVWDGAAAVVPDGWTAEVILPLNILRFPDTPEQRWGFFVERNLPRTHQVFDSILIPRNANAKVSRFGTLVGLKEVEPHRDLEFTPYAAARLALAPRFADPLRPQPRLLDPSGDIGTDLRASLTSSLTLNAALHPDFGQVEADQVILNLQNVEPLFPEKRPFFNQGLDLFQPVGSELGAPNQLFYSRRIGLGAPILGAAKLTGSVRDGLDVGILDAVVMGAGNPTLAPYYYPGSLGTLDPTALRDRLDSAPLDRRLQLHLSEPFHLGLNNELPAARPVTTNFLAAVARQQLLGSSTVGVTFTSAAPLGQACFPSNFPSPPVGPVPPAGETLASYDPSLCEAPGQNVAGLDWNLRTADGQYGLLGIVEGTQQFGGFPAGSPQNQLLDGTYLNPGDLGYGGYAVAGKLGGEPWRFDLRYQYASPKEDFNQVGFLASQNQQRLGAALHFVKPTGLGSLRSFGVHLTESSFFTTDGKWTSRGNFATVSVNAMLPDFQNLGAQLNWEQPRFDVREIHFSGTPMERQGDLSGVVFGTTDANQPLYFEGDVYAFHLFGRGFAPSMEGFGFDTSLVWRPQSRLESQLQVNLSQNPQGARYVTTLGNGQYVFGNQKPAFLSVTLRQQLVLTPKLTLQAYAQFFSDYAHYGPFYTVTHRDGQAVLLSDLQPFDFQSTAGYGNPDFHDTTLNLNVVFRWEYRLGSTLFLVYTRSQQGFLGSSAPPTNLAPYLLGSGPATDTFLVKWTYWWNA